MIDSQSRNIRITSLPIIIEPFTEMLTHSLEAHALKPINIACKKKRSINPPGRIYLKCEDLLGTMEFHSN